MWEAGTSQHLALLEAGFKMTNSGYYQQLIRDQQLRHQGSACPRAPHSNQQGRMIPPRLIHPQQDPSQSPEVLISGSGEGIVLPSTVKDLEFEVRHFPQCSEHHQPPRPRQPGGQHPFLSAHSVHFCTFCLPTP